MRIFYIIAALALSLFVSLPAYAATDGNYTSTLETATWDGTYANLLEPTSEHYTYTFGDDEYLTYDLPASWQFKFYGRPYSQITVDTNGNIWFGTPRSANSFQLPNANLGRVSVVWNDDLSSLYNGGVFIQHKSDQPLGERVVIEWKTESYTDEGTAITNNFEVVLFDNGNIRYDYNPVNAGNLADFGTGITKDDNAHYISVTGNYGSPTTYDTAKSILFTPLVYNMEVVFAGTGGGTVTSDPTGFASNTTLAVPLQAGGDFTLATTPNLYSYFSGWSNSPCSGTGNCLVTLNDNSTVTATFNLEASTRSGEFYPSVQVAYDNAITGDTIYAWDYQFSDGLICDQDREVTILGGYDPIYSSVVGTSRLSNPLIIKAGTVRVKNLAVVGSASAAPMMMTTTLAATDSASALAVSSTSGPALIERNSTGCKTDCDEEDDDHDNDNDHRKRHHKRQNRDRHGDH
jgi:hypothetical protein